MSDIGNRKDMTPGIVKWFNVERGIGFIQSDYKDYFIHYSDIKMEGFKVIDKGDKVLFEAFEGPKGPVARSVHVTSKA
jgi:CspA family cold shock protein